MNATIDTSSIIIETEHLIIRPFKPSDVNDFYNYASIEGVGEQAGWPHHRSIEESTKILNMFIKNKNQLALQLKTNNVVIGSIGFEQLSTDLNNKYNDLLGREIGYVLSKEYWGQGLMPEAVMAVIKYSFDILKYDFLLCRHRESNLQSKRVIEKCGFNFLEKEEVMNRYGEIYTSVYYLLDNKKR